MPPTLTPNAKASLNAYATAHTQGDKPLLPGAIIHITDAQNTPIFSHASGSASPTPQTLFTVHSLTKVIGAIAFFQLVEQSLISLDDATAIPKYLPELAAKQVLTGFSEDADGTKTFTFEDRKGDITPRMLMNHTYGGGHCFFNDLLNTYLTSPPFTTTDWQERNEATDFYTTLLDSPLLWQPGTRTNYGQGFDWIAVLIERVTGRSLVEVLEEGVFAKLGLRETGYEGQYGGSVADGEGDAAARFWPRSLKTEDGFVAIDPPVLSRVVKDGVFPHGTYHMHPLGSGLVSCAADLSRILALLLPQNAGVDPVTGTRILGAEAVRQITSPQLPEELRMNSRNVPTAVPVVLEGNLMGEFVDPEGSFGFGCGVQGADRLLASGQTGRSKGSVYW